MTFAGILPLCGAHSALVVSDGLITDGHYIYRLSFDDLVDDAKFSSDVYAASNVTVYREAPGTASERRYVQATAGRTNASFVYKFDFAGTSYLPDTVSFSDNIYLGNSGSANSVTATTDWSFDGVNWTTIRSKTAAGAPQSSGPGLTTLNLFRYPASQRAAIYYRTTFTSTNGAFLNHVNQWGRCGSGGTGFAVDFVVSRNYDAAPVTPSITNGSIANSHYIYQMSFSDLGNNVKFQNDVSTFSNSAVYQELPGTGSERRFVQAASGATSASFVYKFDFSNTSYLPDSVAFTDYIYLNTSSGANSSTVTTSWSLDGANWSTIRSKTAAGSVQSSGPGSTTIDLSQYPPRQRSVVYYRVTCTSNSGVFPNHGVQWGRCAPGGTGFSADFTVSVNRDAIKEFGIVQPIYAYGDHATFCDQVVASGATWMRMGPTWGSIETSQGVYNTTLLAKLDYIVDQLTSRGVNILWILCYTAPWASSQPADQNAQFYEPVSWLAWSNFVSFVGNRYKGKVKYWEVWNEQDHEGFWKSGVNSYYTLLQNASTQLRQISPENRVVLGGLSTSNASGNSYGPGTFLDSLLAVGSGTARADKYFDILAYHAYGDLRRQTDVHYKTLEVLNKYGIGEKPIWLTETGYSTYGDPGLEYIKANRVDRANLLLKNHANLVKTFWYQYQNIPAQTPLNLKEQNFGLTDSSRLPLRAYYHYQARNGAYSTFQTQKDYATLLPAPLTLYYHSTSSGDGSYIVESGSDRVISANKYMYFRVNDQWIFANNGGLDPLVYLDVTYLDSSNDSWSLNYDANTNAYSSQSCSRGNSGQWVTKTFTLPDVYFGNRQNNSADFRLFAGNNDLTVRQIRVRKDFDIARAVLETADRAKLLEHVVDNNPSSEAYNPVTTAGGLECRQLTSNTKYCYFRTDPEFVYPQDKKISIGVTFWDGGNDTLGIQYNAIGNAYKSISVQKTNTNTWRSISLAITDANLSGSQNYSSDLRITNGGDGSPEYIRAASISRTLGP